jgi:FMN-dependent NADH-azoreductase
MNTLLHIDSSIFSEAGESSRLARAYVDQWHAAHPGATVIERDLAVEPVPHLTADGFRGFLAKPEERTSAQRDIVAYSDRLIAELRRADAIALGLPLYNYGVPSALKAYFDHVARAGVTFRYTAEGPVGLLKGKTARIFATRGGRYQGSALDTQTAYVRDFLRFIGIEDVRFVYAEGLALGEAAKRTALDEAYAAIVTSASTQRLAA